MEASWSPKLGAARLFEKAVLFFSPKIHKLIRNSVNEFHEKITFWKGRSVPWLQWICCCVLTRPNKKRYVSAISLPSYLYLPRTHTVHERGVVTSSYIAIKYRYERGYKDICFWYCVILWRVYCRTLDLWCFFVTENLTVQSLRTRQRVALLNPFVSDKLRLEKRECLSSLETGASPSSARGIFSGQKSVNAVRFACDWRSMPLHPTKQSYYGSELLVASFHVQPLLSLLFRMAPIRLPSTILGYLLYQSWKRPTVLILQVGQSDGIVVSLCQSEMVVGGDFQPQSIFSRVCMGSALSAGQWGIYLQKNWRRRVIGNV